MNGKLNKCAKNLSHGDNFISAFLQSKTLVIKTCKGLLHSIRKLFSIAREPLVIN